jgi:hypothetical protein
MDEGKSALKISAGKPAGKKLL